MESYNSVTVIKAEPELVYQALTAYVPKWWSELFEGSSDTPGATFTVRFGESIYKVFTVEALQLNTRVVWSVIDSVIDIPELENKSEWIGTSIEWDIKSEQHATVLTLSHIGLTPQIECYEICRAGWGQFLASLKAFAETGQGMPFQPR